MSYRFSCKLLLVAALLSPMSALAQGGGGGAGGAGGGFAGGASSGAAAAGAASSPAGAHGVGSAGASTAELCYRPRIPQRRRPCVALPSLVPGIRAE
jgi:hypothetical protein